MSLLGSFNNVFTISPNMVFSPLGEAFRSAVLPQNRISCVPQVPDRKAELPLLVATCEEIEAERTMGKLPIPWDMSHSDINNRSLLKLPIILLSVVLLFGCLFV